MSPYVDGFVLPIMNSRINEYRRVAEQAAKIWLAHGALDYWECVSDDLSWQEGRSFNELAQASQDEVVIFAWAVFESKEARDKANEAICSDPRIAELLDQDKPFCEFSRMAYGGFKALVNLHK